MTFNADRIKLYKKEEFIKIEIRSPTKAFLVDYTDKDLEYLAEELTYTNTAVQHLLKRHQNNHWFKNQNRWAWDTRLKELQASVHNTLIFEENGEKYIRPGSISYLDLPDSSIVNLIQYPEPKKIAWAKPLPFDLYPYQETSVEKLIKVRHGNVELCTGAGKSIILLKICRETGFKCAIVAPSRSIFNELLKLFEKHLGKNQVGRFGDGKKVLGKRITICIGDSLVNVKRGTQEWDFFSKLDAILIDESHLHSSETLEDVNHNLFAGIPYRLFVSGTQMRNSGDTKLLQSIIGPTVHKLSTREAKNHGYICDHEYRIVNIESSNPNYNSDDILVQKRIHLLKNRNICNFIAKFANSAALVEKKQTLVLVQELEQISMLIPLLKVPFSIAHSESKKDRLAELKLEKVDTEESVEKFNKSESMVLVATSCVQTGTNIYPVHYCCWWVGGSSPIMVKQGAIGRSIRLGRHNPYADKCTPKDKAIIWDFNVLNQYVLEKHLEDRIACYEESGTEIKFINLK